jgi:Ring finger domain
MTESVVWIAVAIPFIILFSCLSDYCISRNVGRFWRMANVPINIDPNETELPKKTKRCTTAEEVEALPRIVYIANNDDRNNSILMNKNGTIVSSLKLLSEMNKNKIDTESLNTTIVTTEDVRTTVTKGDIDDGCTAVSLSLVPAMTNEDVESRNVADECCICLEKFECNESLTSLPRCQHIFHPNCVGSWILQRKKNVCPICKTEIFVDSDEHI